MQIVLKKALCVVIVLIQGVIQARATPFESCPSEAFLVQDTVARIYGVNLATGYYEELSSSMATTGKINSVGFNYHDNYIYGFGYEAGNLVRIGSDFQAIAMSVNGLPATNFYVGDVAINENAYYAYRRGSQYGLYRISLEETAVKYLDAEQVVDGAALDLRIYDMAFHPVNGLLYSVDAAGSLHQIDPQTGIATRLANVNESGTFGAVYFDADSNFYISRNSDGHIFRIDIDDENPTAEFFAFGPNSSNNDGARCALAPIIAQESTIDFGDAPSSYGVSIDDNGARHEISDTLFLGDTVGGSDDGVDIVTGFESSLDTLLRVQASGAGLLNGWVDWDQNGSFDSDEQSIVDLPLTSGENRLLLAVPEDAVEGSTWMRMRYSSTPGIGPNGGVADGEVEDHPINVTASGVRIESYPSASSFVTLAFEDNWPALGDYDMNDVVLAYRTRRYVDENNRVVRYDVMGNLLALGASYHNGFAVQLDGVATQNVDESLMRFELDGVSQAASALEQNLPEDDVVVLVSQDLWQHVAAGENCAYYRTQLGCESQPSFSFLVSIPLINSIALDQAPADTLNPFIFATPGRYHGEGFNAQPGRGLEIHLKNKAVSPRFNPNFFGMFDDESDPEGGATFVSVNNMPWAIELPLVWSHPLERIDLIKAYPQFPAFVSSAGEQNKTWYTYPQAISDRVIIND